MDQDGRVWWMSQIRSPQNPPAYCSKGAGNASADYYPQDQKQGAPGDFTQNSRQISFYDQKTKQFGMVDICFNAQHLNFAEDANNTMWIGGNSGGNRGGRLGQYQDVPGNRRREQVAGMVADRR